MKEDYAYLITHKVLADLYPEQLVIFDEWQKQHARTGNGGESGTAHSGVDAIPDMVFGIIVAVQLQGIIGGVLASAIANMIRDRFGPKPLPWIPDDAAIEKLATSIAAAMKAHPPEA